MLPKDFIMNIHNISIFVQCHIVHDIDLILKYRNISKRITQILRRWRSLNMCVFLFLLFKSQTTFSEVVCGYGTITVFVSISLVCAVTNRFLLGVFLARKLAGMMR